jgi:hypothetical protein
MAEDLRPEYDLSALKGRVRGKYFQRATAGSNLVLIEPEVAEVFPDSQAVNSALRKMIQLRQKPSKKPPVRNNGQARPLRRKTK